MSSCSAGRARLPEARLIVSGRRPRSQDMTYQFDFSFLAERWPDFVAGAWLTIQLTVVSIALRPRWSARSAP